MYILLVVLYKKEIMDSSTVKSISSINVNEIPNLKLILWDNSPSDFTQKFEDIQSANIDYDYYRTPENIPLSVIYNRVLNLYHSARCLFIFDQDSNVTEEYFILMKNALERNPDIGLFVPYVKYNDLIVSPGNFHIYKGKYWKQLHLGRISSQNKLCIASGMMLNIPLIRNCSLFFDENLHFYGIDSKFVLDYSRKNPHFFVIDYRLKHNLSQYEKENYQTKLWRFKSQMYATCYIARKHSILAYLLAYFACHIHLLQLFLNKLSSKSFAK